MARSLWKGDFVDPKLFFMMYNVGKFVEKRKFKIQVWSRRSIILPFFVGSVVEVHNGRKFVSLSITKHMVGHKFGEFIFTKKMGRAIHKEISSQKKNVKKKK